jgi:thiol-disulfide isomerase/thioredoxin
MPPGKSSTGIAELGWVMLGDDNLKPKEQAPRRAKVGDYKGKVLVLDLYATWCAPCRVSIPHLVELQRRYGANGLEIVGLNVGGADDRVKVKDFAKEFGIQYSLGFPDQTLSDFLLSDDASIPQTFVFNREGTLVKRFIGYEESITGPLLEQLIQTETAGKR